MNSLRRIVWLVFLVGWNLAQSVPLSLSNLPLFISSNTRANVLFMFGNSNSMDEDVAGTAVGSANSASKSEIARNAIKAMISAYAGSINMGLLAYQQNAPSKYFLHDSQYDLSYDPSNYNANYSGVRNGLTKRFRKINPTSSGNYIYYNVNLPFYGSSAQGNGFCYSSTACTDPSHDFYGIASSSCNIRENLSTGPWDSYSCYSTKIGISDAAPGTSSAGYLVNFLNSSFRPTDSDLGQGITDFGKRLSWQYVSPAWFSNSSPGMGYLHIPIAPLDASQTSKLNTKLATSQFITEARINATYPLQNSGLTPLEGTVITANNYFNGTLLASAQGGPQASPPNSCGKNFLVMLTNGLPSVSSSGVPSSNTVVMLSNLKTQVAAIKNSNASVETYVIGFALPYFVDPTQLNQIAVAGGTNEVYNANDTATLKNAFHTIFNDILRKVASASSVALTGKFFTNGSHLFQARFNSGDWSGQLLSIPIHADGSTGTVSWDAAQVINKQSAQSRVIITTKPSTAQGIPFRWPTNAASPMASELDLDQVAALNTSAGGLVDGYGQARLNWLRGDTTNETTGLGFRERPNSRLGDIVDSAPIYVGAPNANYQGASYASFRTTHVNRSPMIYVGANDGMLHGFDAASGQERVAYIPSQVYPTLSQLSSPQYAHHYYVNGSPTVRDVSYGGHWHTVLASGLGAGGRGVFVLDITDPTRFNENNATALVNFEFSDAKDADVGFITGQLPIAKLNNGKWALLFGNGYNSTGTGYATLFVVDIQTGALLKKISTGVGSPTTPNALSNPVAVDLDANQTIDVVYAGDLQGNLWKFDLSSNTATNWNLAYKLFAQDQPITTTPEVSRHPEGGVLIFFGTGKFLEASDLNTMLANNFYAIRDKGSAVTDGIVAQTVIGTKTVNGINYRLVSQNTINWATKNGWSLALPNSGERMVTDPTVVSGRIVFTTMMPSSTPCSYGGSSWLMELNYLDGSMLGSPPFDTNQDRLINTQDIRVAGRSLASIASSPAILQGFGTSSMPIDIKFSNESSGIVTDTRESRDARTSRRTSWTQMK